MSPAAWPNRSLTSLNRSRSRQSTARLSPLGQVRDFLIDTGVEVTAVGERGQRVVMREVVDMLLGLLARLQVAHRDDMVRPSGENDRPQQQLDRRHRAVAMTQARFDRLVRSGEQLGPCDLVRKATFKPGADQAGGGQAGEKRKTGVDGDDRLAIANQQSFHRGVGEVAHAVDFELRASRIADVEHDARERQSDNDEARERHRDRKPGGRKR